jgi:putative ABC transport system ATP-binding protein
VTATTAQGAPAADRLDGARPVAELIGVDRVYPGHPPVRALRGVSLRVDEGELVGIVGPSGSGKTTLLNILGTLDRADAGTVRIDGHDLSTLTDRQLSALRAHRIDRPDARESQRRRPRRSPSRPRDRSSPA